MISGIAAMIDFIKVSSGFIPPRLTSYPALISDRRVAPGRWTIRSSISILDFRIEAQFASGAFQAGSYTPVY